MFGLSRLTQPTAASRAKLQPRAQDDVQKTAHKTRTVKSGTPHPVHSRPIFLKGQKSPRSAGPYARWKHTASVAPRHAFLRKRTAGAAASVLNKENQSNGYNRTRSRSITNFHLKASSSTQSTPRTPVSRKPKTPTRPPTATTPKQARPRKPATPGPNTQASPRTPNHAKRPTTPGPKTTTSPRKSATPKEHAARPQTPISRASPRKAAATTPKARAKKPTTPGPKAAASPRKVATPTRPKTPTSKPRGARPAPLVLRSPATPKTPPNSQLKRAPSASQLHQSDPNPESPPVPRARAESIPAANSPLPVQQAPKQVAAAPVQAPSQVLPVIPEIDHRRAALEHDLQAIEYLIRFYNAAPNIMTSEKLCELLGINSIRFYYDPSKGIEPGLDPGVPYSHLNIDFKTIPSDVTVPENYKTLALLYDASVYDDLLLYLTQLGKWPHLEQVILVGCRNITRRGLLNLQDRDCLKELFVSDCRDVSNESTLLIQLLEHVPHLQKLSIFGALIDRECVDGLGSLPVQELDLSFSHFYSDVSLDPLYAYRRAELNLNPLKTLRLFSTTYATDRMQELKKFSQIPNIVDQPEKFPHSQYLYTRQLPFYTTACLTPVPTLENNPTHPMAYFHALSEEANSAYWLAVRESASLKAVEIEKGTLSAVFYNQFRKTIDPASISMGPQGSQIDPKVTAKFYRDQLAMQGLDCEQIEGLFTPLDITRCEALLQASIEEALIRARVYRTLKYSRDIDISYFCLMHEKCWEMKKQLRTLDLSGTQADPAQQLFRLPTSFLKGLFPNLIQVDMSYNQCNEPPIFWGALNVKKYNASHNCIRAISPEFSERCSNNLEEFNLDGNPFPALPIAFLRVFTYVTKNIPTNVQGPPALVILLKDTQIQKLDIPEELASRFYIAEDPAQPAPQIRGLFPKVCIVTNNPVLLQAYQDFLTQAE